MNATKYNYRKDQIYEAVLKKEIKGYKLHTAYKVV